VKLLSGFYGANVFFEEEHNEEEKKKKKRKSFKRVITIQLDNKFMEKLKKMKFLNGHGIADVIIKDSEGKITRERVENSYWRAIEIGLQFKREIPENTVKVIIKT